jgi:hypothetical protein
MAGHLCGQLRNSALERGLDGECTGAEQAAELFLACAAGAQLE